MPVPTPYPVYVKEIVPAKPPAKIIDVPFWQDFYGNLASGVLVFALGIPAGLAIDRFSNRSRIKEKREQLRKAILLSLVDSRVKLEAMSIYVSLSGVEAWEDCYSYRLDMSVLDSTAALKYELLDTKAALKIDHVRSLMLSANAQIIRVEEDLASAIRKFGPGGPNPAVATSSETFDWIYANRKRVAADVAAPLARAMRELEDTLEVEKAVGK